MAARKPVMSPRTPPPKARRSESRSAPAVARCWARDSTLLMRLCDSPLGRKRTVGGSLKLARKGFDQRAQMSGEVMTKGRKDLSLLSLLRRGWRVRRRSAPMVTLYFAEGVLTGMMATVLLSYRREAETLSCRTGLLRGVRPLRGVYTGLGRMAFFGPPVSRE